MVLIARHATYFRFERFTGRCKAGCKKPKPSKDKMNKATEEKLRKFVRERQKENDRSYDFQHILRVRNIAVKISKKVDADQRSFNH